MKFVTISKECAKLYAEDPQMLHKGMKRPHLLVLDLNYKGELRRFAVPLRSNIPPAAPKKQYFPLPPRATTKKGYRHGIHYIKMFPILKKHQVKFRVDKGSPYEMYQAIIDKNKVRIVRECQNYLLEYENGNKPKFSVDIDAAIERLSDK